MAQLSQPRSLPTKAASLPPLIIQKPRNFPSLTLPGAISSPVASTRPKLSLKTGSDIKRTFATSGSFSSSRLTDTPGSESGDVSNDLTTRNTIANTHIRAASIDTAPKSAIDWSPSYTFTQVNGTKSILKRQCSSETSTPTSKAVSFILDPSIIPPGPAEDDESDSDCVPPTPIVDEFDDNLSSPPSTTSSTDSEESESDTEPKTPVDEVKSFKHVDSWGKAAGFGAGGKWRKPKREWVWTLGGSDQQDIREELEYSGVKLQSWGEDMMVQAV